MVGEVEFGFLEGPDAVGEVGFGFLVALVVVWGVRIGTLVCPPAAAALLTNYVAYTQLALQSTRDVLEVTADIHLQTTRVSEHTHTVSS